MEEKKKKALFEGLYALDEDSQDETEELSRIETILPKIKPPTTVKNRNAPRNARGNTSFLQHPKNVLGRTVSAPLQPSVSSHVPATRAPPSSHLSFTPRANVLTQKHLSNDLKQKTASKMNKTTKPAPKRKRGQSLQLVPESQQIFRGLSFYFYPNNDIAAPRKIRIRKAIEFGAVWTKEWSEDVTHIIVDDDLNYEDLLKHLKVDSLPARIVVGNENYPAYCIGYRFLVNPDHPLYEVKGHKKALQAHLESVPSTPSTNSLVLKPSNGDAASQRTPSRTESSSRDIVPDANSKPTSNSVAPQASEQSVHSIKYNYDALSEAIEEAKITKHLPLDSDEDENIKRSSSFDFSDDDSEEDQRPRSRTINSSSKSWQQSFSCMSKHDGTSKDENPNARTIEILQQMADYYDRVKDHWRTLAYRKVVGQLKKADQKIVTVAQALQLPGVGDRLAAKIEEIVWTDKLRRLESTKLEPNDEVLQKFLNVYGVGLAQATKWVDQGHRTLADLLEKVSLTKNQKIGIEHYDDFQQRIPRDEMQQHNSHVCEFVKIIEKKLQFTIGGSYRRGASSSGDIDFIITMRDASLEVVRTIMLDTVIPRLFESGYLRIGLATTDKDDGSKWHGAAALPGHSTWRRIDFLFVPWNEIGAALIYFTGNDIFNRSIRLLASKKGMRLNQRGLWTDVIRGKNRGRMTQGTLVEAKDEKKIFEHLGVPWLPPEQRIC